MLAKKLEAAVAGQATGTATYVEDVFSTYLYTGNGSTQTITNGIDLDGEGGLVWFKARSTSYGSMVFDSERGDFSNYISTFDTGGNNWAGDLGWSVGTFNSDGFTVPYGTNPTINGSGVTMASWTFRKAPKFFDVVTYTGTGSAQNIAHNLGSVPGCIIVKCTSNAYNWAVYHRSLTSNAYALQLNNANAQTNAYNYWNSTTPTDSVFTVGTDFGTNQSGQTYVAYLFAHDAGGFGDSGDESVIKCGTYTGDGTAGGPLINLGWEPQWILSKKASSTGSWILSDNMRGLGAWNGVSSGGVSSPLFANSASAEDVGGDYPAITSTGYYPTNQSGNILNASGETYIYIAIRRGPMKTPTDATTVFTPLGYTGTSTSSSRDITGNTNQVDTVWHKSRVDTFQWNIYDRLRGNKRLNSNTTDSEVASNSYGYIDNFDVEKGYSTTAGGVNNENFNKTDSTYISWNFTRAPGFHDVVCFQGQNGGRTVPHNLGVSPELVITKVRNLSGASWWVFHKDLGLSTYLEMNSTNAAGSFTNAWNPTATDVFFAQAFITSSSSYEVVAYLFASAPGVSKVGTFTGTGSDHVVDCGFSNGARFVLWKQVDGVNGWAVVDTARGINAGNDPYLLLNSTAAESSIYDVADPSSSGFIVTSAFTSGTYIYLAIA